MNKDLTDITVIQDKSSSMGKTRFETITGFNSFLTEQRRVPGKCLISLTQFNTDFHSVYDGVDIQNVELLTAATYITGGYTALLDAIGFTVTKIGKRLEKMPEAERPGRVVVVITTDGEENSSKAFAHETIMAMIRDQTEKYNWQFIFLGANQDAIFTGRSLGIGSANSISSGITGQAVCSSYGIISDNIKDYREADPADVAKLQFKKSQRMAQKLHGAKDDALNQ